MAKEKAEKNSNKVGSINKTTPDLSIVKRLGGSGAPKVRHLFGLCKGFWKKSEEMEVVFNRCWMFRDAKCGICKSKWGNYKPYWAVRRIGCKFG